MAHDHVYGVCEAKCFVEVVDKVTQNAKDDEQDTAIANKLDKTGTAEKATADGDGNNIVSTYATKTEMADAVRKPIVADFSSIVTFDPTSSTDYNLVLGNIGNLSTFIGISYGSDGTSIYGNESYDIIDITPFIKQYINNTAVSGGVIPVILRGTDGTLYQTVFMQKDMSASGMGSGGKYVSMATITPAGTSPKQIRGITASGSTTTANFLGSDESGTGIRLWRCS